MQYPLNLRNPNVFASQPGLNVWLFSITPAGTFYNHSIKITDRHLEGADGEKRSNLLDPTKLMVFMNPSGWLKSGCWPVSD